MFNVILGVLALKQCKQLRVSDDAGLERLGQAVDDLTAGQGLERVKIDKHDLGLPECADDVLRLAQINRRLAADGGIHLRKHRRGAVDKVNAAHVAGRAEAAQIAHNAAADGHQQILAVHAERQHSLQNLTVDLQAFAASPRGSCRRWNRGTGPPRSARTRRVRRSRSARKTLRFATFVN